jgi:hypothetical protein
VSPPETGPPYQLWYPGICCTKIMFKTRLNGSVSDPDSLSQDPDPAF